MSSQPRQSPHMPHTATAAADSYCRASSFLTPRNMLQVVAGQRPKFTLRHKSLEYAHLNDTPELDTVVWFLHTVQLPPDAEEKWKIDISHFPPRPKRKQLSLEVHCYEPTLCGLTAAIKAQPSAQRRTKRTLPSAKPITAACCRSAATGIIAMHVARLLNLRCCSTCLDL